ncbi:hypothetical protein S4A8_14484 [Salinisphaera sp. S4-8]|uniref:hypothetical protein n=1 Tax=Salinisphaera sp. S4-8 TaxID=633357 RepID=UPI0033401B7C
MQHSLKIAASGLCVALCSLLIAGCAGTGTPANYENLPGSGDKMAEGPGLMSPARGDEYDDGVRVYSDDASKPALINRDSRRRQTAQRNDAGAATTATTPSAAQQQEFADYEEYQRFRNMPKDSPEYQRFKDWQEWKQYQQWKDSQQR